MVRDALFKSCVADIELAAINELLKKLRVVNYFVFSTKLWLLVGECVEAVRTLRDDLFDTHAVEHVNVGHGQHLEQVLVT